MVGPGVLAFYPNFQALDAAVIAFSAQFGLTRWTLESYETQNSRESIEASKKRKHQDKCGKRRLQLPCHICDRERRLYFNYYKLDYRGEGLGGHAKIFATAVCKCGLQNTHCHGCVVKVEMGFPLPPRMPGAPRKKRMSPIQRTRPAGENDRNSQGHGVHSDASPSAARQLDFTDPAVAPIVDQVVARVVHQVVTPIVNQVLATVVASADQVVVPIVNVSIGEVIINANAVLATGANDAPRANDAAQDTEFR